MRSKRTEKLTITSLFVAIIIIMTLVPFLGYIPLGTINVTIVHIPVIIGAYLMGPGVGAVLGLCWGFLSFIRSFRLDSLFAYVLINPLVSVLPRVLVGWLSGYIGRWTRRYFSSRVAGGVTGACGALMNTFFVCLAIILFAADTYSAMFNVPKSGLIVAFVATMGVNCLFETIAAAVLCSLLSPPLEKVMAKRGLNNQFF